MVVKINIRRVIRCEVILPFTADYGTLAIFCFEFFFGNNLKVFTTILISLKHFVIDLTSRIRVKMTEIWNKISAEPKPPRIIHNFNDE